MIFALLLTGACSLATQDAAVGDGQDTPTECGSNPSSLAPGGRQESGVTHVVIGGPLWSDALNQVCAPLKLETIYSPPVGSVFTTIWSFLALHPGYASY